MPSIQGEVYVEPHESDGNHAPLPFSVGEALDAGLSGLKREWLVLTLAQIIPALPGALIGLASHYLLGEAALFTRAYFERTLVTMAASSVIASLFRGGITKISLDVARGKKPQLADLGRGVRFFLPMLALEIMQLVALVLGAALLFVPYVLVWMGFVLTPMWLVDRNCGLVSAMRASWRATRGERVHLFGFVAASLVVSYLGVLACCVGSFPAEALTAVAGAYVYLRFAGEELEKKSE